jgi:uncharacterized protein YuzE
MEFDLKIDRETDAAYVRIRSAPVARTQALDDRRIVDYEADGEIRGIEFLDVREGVDLRDLPYRPELERLFGDRDIPIYA